MAAVGADHPEKQEVEPELLSMSGVIADVLDQCVAMGDLHHALEAGVMRREDVRGELADMVPDGKGRVRLDYRSPSRGLIGFQTEYRTMTSGTGLMYHVFDTFAPVVDKQLAERSAGVMISNARGEVLAYALFNLQERGRLFVAPGDVVYEGQIVGESSRATSLPRPSPAT